MFTNSDESRQDVYDWLTTNMVFFTKRTSDQLTEQILKMFVWCSQLENNAKARLCDAFDTAYLPGSNRLPESRM